MRRPLLQLLLPLAIASGIFLNPAFAGDAFPAPGTPEYLEALPPDTAYVTIGPDGHLQLNGERVRYWGLGGGMQIFRNVPDTLEARYRATDAMVKRLREQGYTLIRSWNGMRQDKESAYTPGDGSYADILDYFHEACRREGIKVWLAGYGNNAGRAYPEHVDVIDDPETAEAWQAAVGEKGWKLGKNGFATMWDPRLKAIRRARLVEMANHVNQYNGLRWADDPLFVVWELVNEDWWFHNMQRGRFLNLPDFFLNSLVEQWNAFLLEKYGDAEGLSEAWIGNLLEGEDVEAGTVRILPLASDLSDEAQAKSLGVNVGDALTGDLDMAMFNGRREADVIEFFLKIWLETKEEEKALVKSLGKSTRLSPVIYDTGIGWGAQTQYMHQHSEAVVHSTYINGQHHPDATHRRYPWWSSLDQLPFNAWTKPWLEQNRIEGKPFFVYEHNTMNPGKYRAEHPMRMAHLASIQDWDIICAHYWGFPRDPDDPNAYDSAMDYTLGGHPQGYHIQFDAVLQASMTLAGEIFQNLHLKPAPDPTTFVVGRKALHSFDFAGYGEGFEERFAPTAYRWGSRIRINPDQEENEIIGESRRRNIYEPSPISATDQMTFDYQNARLTFDAPGAAMFCGFFGETDGTWTFDQAGITITDLKVVNDPEIAFPVTEDEEFIVFGVTTRDGLPLAESRDAVLAAVSTSFNDNFELDLDYVNKEWFLNRKAFPNRDGGLPVRYARVGLTLDAKPLQGMTYRLLDWHHRVIGEGVINGDTFTLPADQPVFLVELSR
ncbi:MAG: hypothetical protein ACFE0O_13930 [Opitutales bacterium]